MKLRWTTRDIAEYLEYKIVKNLETEDEIDMYIDYLQNGVFDKQKYINTYKIIIKEMKREYEGGD